MFAIEIKNIGIIDSAEIDINGLSVIAGDNDTGKSTVGKLIFSIIKAISRYKEDFNLSKEKQIEESIEDIYRYMRSPHRISAFTTNLKQTKNIASFKQIKDNFYPPTFLQEISTNKLEVAKLIEKKIKFVENLPTDKITIKRVSDKLNELKKLIFTEVTKKDEIIKTLSHLFTSEFKKNISSFNNKPSSIILKENGKILIKIDIKKNEIIDIPLLDAILEIKNVSFIETPLFLNFWEIFDSYRYDDEEIPYHNIDLHKKIRNSKYADENENSLNKNIAKIIKGNFLLDESNLDEKIMFQKKNFKQKIDIEEVASGIKSFGILDFLDKADALNNENLLIIDEPEVHLHPKWQIEYAKLLIYLVETRNLKILIASHSHYFIQALIKYSQNHIDEKVNFYLSKKDKQEYVKIENKTNKKSEILEKLVEPFEQLVWD